MAEVEFMTIDLPIPMPAGVSIRFDGQVIRNRGRAGFEELCCTQLTGHFSAAWWDRSDELDL
jgi:hypothetical protein